jgi:hypothetical protein
MENDSAFSTKKRQKAIEIRRENRYNVRHDTLDMTERSEPMGGRATAKGIAQAGPGK